MRLFLALLMLAIFIVPGVSTLAADKSALQNSYQQMDKDPHLYQVTEPHVVGGQAKAIGTPCGMPPGTIYYDKPHDNFLYCDGKTWKPFPGTAKD